MASYIPAQRAQPVWESQYASPQHRPPIVFPHVSSGSQRDYSGHHSGAPEFDMPTLGHLAGEVKHQLGNLLLYGRLWDSEHPLVEHPKEEEKAEETPEPLAVPGARQPLAVAAGEPTAPAYRFGGAAPGYAIGRTPWMAAPEAVAGVPRAPWTEAGIAPAAQVGGNTSAIAAAGRNIPIAARLNTVARPPLSLLNEQPVTRSRTQRRAAGANLSRIKQDPPMDYRIKG